MCFRRLVCRQPISRSSLVSRLRMLKPFWLRRPISAAEADYIGTLCGNGADIWLRLQAAYDGWQPPAHDFRHATMHSLADWPVLSRIAARHTKAKRLDSRAVAALYARATGEDRQAMDSRELAYADAALNVWASPHQLR